MPEPKDSRTPKPKSEQTRTLILETAMRLFQERGYDRTTMRAVAQEAGVSVGNAYYYFSGKEHLIQGFYDRIGAEHKVAARAVLERETDLQARLAGVLKAWLDVAEPYHEFAAQFFKNAADPDSPLSPFSTDSRAPREESIGIFREVLAGSKAKVPAELKDTLPELMWLSLMGLVVYWVFDRTPGRERSYRLAERGARLTTLGVTLARFRVLRPLVREVHELFTDFLPGMGDPDAERAEGGARAEGAGADAPAPGPASTGRRAPKRAASAERDRGGDGSADSTDAKPASDA
ncbi:TetR family transcriptional regulator [Streptomyces fragilis]|uniref:TetR family transcriptional regulator n=1 Tax=Streptomyces fragilis TaxID=67301 RepID=A0ABV2YIH9_9ACTN|nr:TetR family transcriptional regulator [Streptomyces fragilis]